MNAFPFISCVIPVFNEEAVIAQFVESLNQQLLSLGYSYEMIIVDDGSEDQTQTRMFELKARYPIRYLRFSRNFGKERAISAGLEHARGEAIILVDADFQHPLNLLPNFIAKWQEGYDMVYAVRQNREVEPWFQRVCASVFYQLISKIDRVHIPANAGDFRLMDKKIVSSLKKLPERNRFMKGLYAWVGFKHVGIPYDALPRIAGSTRWKFSSLLDLAIIGITSFTAFPLRMIALGGIGIAGIAILYAFWIILSTLLFGIITPGWATIVTTITFFGGLQLFAIGIVGEYIGRIFEEVKQRPNYIIDEEASFDSCS